MPASRIDATDEALELIDRLVEAHGPLLFHQSGGCCDGSSPMCFPLGEFRIGASDVYLGEVGGAPFHLGAAQFESGSTPTSPSTWCPVGARACRSRRPRACGS